MRKLVSLLFALLAFDAYALDIKIQTSSGIVPLNVETAKTTQDLKKGLMFRSKPPSDGMLFIFPDARYRSMWMKNTYIPLDIIFFDEDNKICDIFSNAQPHSLKALKSRKPIKYALEIAAGKARLHQLELGDKLVCECLVLNTTPLE